MLLLLALACSPDDATALEPWLPIDEPEAIRELPERARITEIGAASFTPGGPLFRVPDEGEFFAMGGGHDPTYRDVVVTDIDETLQVAWENRDVRLLVRLDRADLREQLVEDTWARAAPDAMGTSGTGVRFRAGYTDVGAPSRGWRPLFFEGLYVQATGWVPSDDVDHYWVPTPREPTERWGEAVEHINIHREAPLLDAPDGEELALVTQEQAPVAVYARDGDWLRVELTDREVTVRGWVHDEHRVTGGLMGFGCCCGGSIGSWGIGSWGSTAPDTVLRDDRLYTGPFGQEVGIALRDMPLAVIDEEGEWIAVEVSTPWGFAEVWVDTWAR